MNAIGPVRAATAHGRGATRLLVAIADLLAYSDRADAALGRELAAESAGYRRGFADGHRDGYRQGREDEAQDWFASLAPARDAARKCAAGPSYAELERLRWGPDGREHFGDPRPGDYRGERPA